MRQARGRSFALRQRSWNWAIGFLVAAATIFSGALQHSAHAEPGFPNRPIRILVPYGPGGVGDFTMRLVGEKLSK
jgi:tripartite-type tricarboxylate transporter receptor subunit TctC